LKKTKEKNHVEIQKIKKKPINSGEVQNSQELKQIRKQGATLDREEQASVASS
jgi:hypothetical protein